MVRSGYRVIATLTAALLAACGGKESSDTPAEQAEIAPASEAAPAPTMDITGAPAAERAPATEPAPVTETAQATEPAPAAATDDEIDAVQPLDADAQQRVAHVLTDGSPVRVESTYLESGWLEGTIGPSPSGCRMVFLSKPIDGGYTSVALMTLKRVERKNGENWQEVPVEPLLEAEPSHCLEAAAD